MPTLHKSKNIEEAINARGAKLIFSPPYSPKLSPIEYYWAKIKKYLKENVQELVMNWTMLLRKRVNL
ncbi:MAG: transposase [Nitrospirae bacterium]|nr:transposase [Nitrospirota bacterium]